MKSLSFFLFFLFTSIPAFAQNIFCVDNQDSDKIIELVVEGGRVVGATYSNQDHGNLDDRPLQPGEYSYNGATLNFAGDVYSCQ